MTQPYRITKHAQRRIRSRDLPVEHVYAALFGGTVVPRPGGCQAHIDDRSRVAVIVDPNRRMVVTAFRLKPPRKPRRRRPTWRMMRG